MTRDIFQAPDLNGEPKWFFWHAIDGQTGTAIGPFETARKAREMLKAVSASLAGTVAQYERR